MTNDECDRCSTFVIREFVIRHLCNLGVFRLFWHVLQNLEQYFIGVDAFGFGFEIEDHAVPHGRQEHAAHIFEADVVPAA